MEKVTVIFREEDMEVVVVEVSKVGEEEDNPSSMVEEDMDTVAGGI